MPDFVTSWTTTGGEVFSVEEMAAAASEASEESNPVNPILPSWAEIWWGLGTFLVLWALMKWVLVPPIQKIQEQRADHIREARHAAKGADRDAQRLQEEFDAGVASAKAEATRIIDDARYQGESARKDLKTEVDAELTTERQTAAAEIEAAKQQALDALQPSVTKYAVQAAGQVVERPIDESGAAPIVREYVREVANEDAAIRRRKT